MHVVTGGRTPQDGKAGICLRGDSFHAVETLVVQEVVSTYYLLSLQQLTTQYLLTPLTTGYSPPTTHYSPLTAYIHRRYDIDHDFNIKASELRNLVEDMQPMGQPKPPEKELQVRTSDALCSLQACVDARYLLTTVCILFVSYSYLYRRAWTRL